MDYSEYTFTRLKEEYDIVQQSTRIFQTIPIVSKTPSARLQEDLTDAQTMPLYSEKAKSEAIIYPIIRELKKNNPQISVFSGYTFSINTQLTGAPDFLISAKPNLVEPQCPIFCLVESKNKSPEEGFAQCAAEMYAAQIFNKRMKEPDRTIFGTVTNGFDWIFLKLEENVVIVDIDRYYLNELPKLLGIFQYVIENVENI